ncbi:hypothetical protein B0H14DRAFT_3549917 [Mycena olivaceomarginata]|nr:hypothetical protein B0H14DRAFT_3549917 [Mycena olivaceomarginata]
MAPRVPIRDGSTRKNKQPASFDPWVAIRPLDKEVQRVLFAMANQQLLDHSWFPSEHLRFTHGLHLVIELVDPKHQDQSLAGITWPAKSFTSKQMPEDWTVDEGRQFICLPPLDSVVLISDEEPTEPIQPPAAKSKGKGKTGVKKTNKQGLSPSTEESTSKKPRKPDSKVVVMNEVISEDEPATKLTAEEQSALNKWKKDMAAGRLLRRPEAVPLTSSYEGKSVAEAQYAAMYPYYRKKHLAAAHTSCAALSTVTTIIPDHEQQALPVDDSGRFYVLPFDIITTAVGGSVPMDGPWCTACQLASSVHTASACEFTFSDEVLNDLGPERALWFDMSAPGWQRAAEDLEVASKTYALAQKARDSAEKEMRLKSACFPSPDCITSQLKLHQQWEWNLFHSDQLLAPIPGFIDAYDFYNAFDQECAHNPNFNRLGYFLVPKPGEKGAAEWVEIQPSDLATVTLSDSTTLHCGVSGSHAQNCFMREVFERENITLPQAYKDLDLIHYPSPTIEDGNLGFISDLKSFFNPSTVEPPLPDSLIPIEKGDTPTPVGEDFLDLEAVKSSGSGSGSGSSSEESDVDILRAIEESESGEDVEEGEAIDNKSEEGSDDE